MTFSPGTRLKHYEIVSLLGSGGMGVVYKALDRRLDRLVAIKVLHHVSPERRQRFEREARVVASLQHARICTLIDIGVHDGIDYLVMEYLDGRPLPCPQPFASVIEYGMQIADALDAAHRRGIAHRDLKPANIIVTGDGVKLLDFGIAKAADMETLTQEGVPVGTPGYMSPEQWRGESTDHRSDIYALGCVLHEMATGQRARETPIDHPLLESVVKGCLAQSPDDRWQSARDVRRLLAGIAEGRAVAVRPKRRRRLAAAAVLAPIAAAALAWSLKPSPARPPLYLAMMPPPNAAFHVARNREGGVALAPDGTMLAFVATTAGKAQLWIRRLDSIDARPLPGTDGAFYPFWSPDAQWIAFFTPARLIPSRWVNSWIIWMRAMSRSEYLRLLPDVRLGARSPRRSYMRSVCGCTPESSAATLMMYTARSSERELRSPWRPDPRSGVSLTTRLLVTSPRRDAGVATPSRSRAAA